MKLVTLVENYDKKLQKLIDKQEKYEQTDGNEKKISKVLGRMSSLKEKEIKYVRKKIKKDSAFGYNLRTALVLSLDQLKLQKKDSNFVGGLLFGATGGGVGGAMGAINYLSDSEILKHIDWYKDNVATPGTRVNQLLSKFEKTISKAEKDLDRNIVPNMNEIKQIWNDLTKEAKEETKRYLKNKKEENKRR